MKTKTTRRCFLKQSAFAAVMPTIVSSTVFGKNAPSNRINLAVIGCGSRAGFVALKDFNSFENVRFLAAVDPVRERRESFAKTFNDGYGLDICKPYENYKDCLADERIDGVLIVTPDHWHVPIAIAAAEAGKDMYVEKPLGIALKWSQKLRQVCKNKDIIFQYGTQQRSTDSARRAVDLVQNGYVGKIKRVDVWSPHLPVESIANPTEIPVPDGFNYDLYVGPAEKKPFVHDRASTPGSWHCYEFALGFIAGWGAHPLDICQWGLNMDHTSPVSYKGSGTPAPQEDKIWNTTRRWDILCKYPNGLDMRFMDTQTAEPLVKQYHRAFKGDGTTFHGTEGWVSYSRGACYMSIGGKWIANTLKFKLKDTDSRTYLSTSHSRNFIDCMKTRKPTINPLESAIRSDTISHLSDIVVRTGQEIQWDPETERMIKASRIQQAYLNRTPREPYSF
jgi:predicted dehydrogenase